MRRALFLLLLLCDTAFGADSGPACLRAAKVSLLKEQGEVQRIDVERAPGVVTEFVRTDRSLKYMIDGRIYPRAAFLDLEDKRVLDLGAGGGQLVRDLRDQGISAYGLDLHLSAAQKGTSYLFERDALHTGLGDRTFDVIFSTLSIYSYELKNPVVIRAALTESLRILKPGGALRMATFTAADAAYLKTLIAGMPVAELRWISTAGELGYIEVLKAAR